MLTGNVPTTSEWSTILLPAKVWLILEVWWQGKKRSSIFKQNLSNYEETYISIGNLLPPSREICIPRMVQPCRKLYMMYVSCTIYRLIGVHLWHFHNITRQCMSCVTSIMVNPLEVPEVLREGPRGPKSCLGSYICLQTVGRFLHLWYMKAIWKPSAPDVYWSW